ncbi:hypothetical protein SAMN05216359_1132 [Roseateles sp. YR242]|uniref:hypothetical protein n=1 Tax=Roseateles sp. YR242 TaxID=1855305 RepID=UPI0008CD2F5D|nr:hypothetical protein [Roseateles sp. YR242]SEL65047.1 hypothetical protein SAMN05216359_1132 [Roseateles sp. YR242]
MASTLNTPKPPTKGLRPGLLWTLGLTAAATAWALLSPADGNVTAAAKTAASGKDRPQADPTRALTPAANANRKPAVAPLPPIPGRLPELALEAADRDPFMIPVPPPPPAPPPPPPPPPPPAPTAPPLNYRFLGAMVDPQGDRKVYLARADKDVLVEVGSRLDEGYRVEAITEDEIRLIYEPLQQRAVIRIPPAQPTP